MPLVEHWLIKPEVLNLSLEVFGTYLITRIRIIIVLFRTLGIINKKVTIPPISLSLSLSLSLSHSLTHTHTHTGIEPAVQCCAGAHTSMSADSHRPRADQLEAISEVI